MALNDPIPIHEKKRRDHFQLKENEALDEFWIYIGVNVKQILSIDVVKSTVKAGIYSQISPP